MPSRRFCNATKGSGQVLSDFRLPLGLPVVTIAEYEYGILGSMHAHEIWPTWNVLLENSIPIAIDRSVARHFALIKQDLRRKGLPIPTNDLWIAAIAAEHGLPVLSRDKHYDRIEGLTRIGW